MNTDIIYRYYAVEFFHHVKEGTLIYKDWPLRCSQELTKEEAKHFIKNHQLKEQNGEITIHSIRLIEKEYFDKLMTI